jgi:hypothetical protein
MSAQIVREIAAAAFKDAIDILAIIEVLSAQNHEARWQQVNQAGAGRAADIIKRALLSRLVILVARAYAPTKLGDLHAQMAFVLLKDGSIAAQMPHATDLAEAQRLWSRCRGDHRLNAFLHFRDKQLAHVGTARSDIGLPTMDDELGLARDTTRALEKLAHGTGVVGLSLDTQMPAYRESAERFFAHWGEAR